MQEACAGALAVALDRLDLTDSQAALVPTIVPQELRALETGQQP